MKHFGYGSGMSGCLFDYGPNFAETNEDAIEGILLVFGEELSDEETAELRESLTGGGSYYFRNPGEVGAQYCEVWVEDGPLPSDDDDDDDDSED
jgi:hypothetical protein